MSQRDGKKFERMKKRTTIQEKYSPAMEITTQEEADQYFEALVLHSMTFGKTREEAEKLERENLAYFAGYHDHETRLRVEKLFRCEHPLFGPATKGAPTFEQALNIGYAIGRAMKKAE